MPSRPIDEKIVKLSVDNADFQKQLNNSITFLQQFNKGVATNTDIKTDKFESGMGRIGSSVSGLLSKIPILGNFKKSTEDSTNVNPSNFETFTSRIGGAVSGLTSRIPILSSFHKAAQDSIDLDATQAVDAVSQAGGALGGMSTRVAQVGQSFSVMQMIAFGALASIGAKAVDTGLQLVKSMSLGKIEEGFQQYSDQTNSIMMLQGALGAGAMDQINGALQDLDHYAAVTKYSIADMNTNLAQFVNNGVKIGDAQVAIKGWGNLAASAGASTQSFGASLQFGVSQALAMGKMTTQNWMSIENAGMATQKFKDALVEQGKTMGKNIDLSGGFRDSLQQGWLTNDVFIATMKKMADDPSMLAMAQDFHSFGEVSDAVTEGVTAGWSKMFKGLFGSLDDSTKMWTDFGNMMIEYTSGDKSVFIPLTKGAEDFGEKFRALGGLTLVVKTFGAAFDSVHKIMGAVGDSFKAVFPISAQGSAQAVVNVLKNLVQAFTVGKNTITVVTSIFVMLFKTLDVGLYLLKEVAKVFVNLIPKGDGEGIAYIVSLLTSFVIRADNAILAGKGLSSFFDTLQTSASNISKVVSNLSFNFDDLVSIFEKIGGVVSPVIASVFGKIADSIKALFGGFTSQDFTNLLSLGGLALIAVKISGVTKHFSDLGDGIKDAGKNIAGVLDIFKALPEALSALTGSIKAATLMEIAVALGVLVLALKLLSTIDTKQTITSLAALTAEFKILEGGLESITKSLNPTSTIKLIAAGVAIQALAMAMLVVTGAVKILSTMSPGDLALGLGAFAVAMGVMVKGLQGISNIGPKVFVAALAMNMVATAMTQLIIPIEILGRMDPNKLGTGLVGLALGMGLMINGLKSMSKITGDGKLLVSAAAMVAMAFALNEMAVAVKIMASIPLDSMIKGLSGLAAALVIINITERGMKNPTGIIAMATGLLILSGALKVMASIPFASLMVALLGMAGALTIITVAMNFMNGSIGGAASFAIMAAALIPLALALKLFASIPLVGIGTGLLAFAGATAIMVVAAKALQGAALGVIAFDLASVGMVAMAAAVTTFAGALVILGNIPLEKIGVGLLGLAGMMAIIVATGYAMAGASVGLLSFGASALMVGAGIMLLGVGVNDLADAFSTISKINMSVALKNFKAFISGTISLIPTVITAIMEAVGLILVGFVKMSPKIIDALNSIIDDFEAIIPSIIGLVNKLLIALNKVIPKFVDFGVKTINAFLEGVQRVSPVFTDTMVLLVLDALDGMSITIPAFINFALDMIQALLTGISTHISDMTQTGIDIITNFFTGILDGIAKNTPIIVDHMMSAAIAFINALSQGIKTYGPALNASILGLFNALADQLITSLSDILQVMLRPFDAWDGNLSKTVGKGAADAKDALDKNFSAQQAQDLAQAAANGYVAGLSTPILSASDATKALADAAKNGVNGVDTELGILGAKGGQSFVQGINDGSIPASQAGELIKEAAASGASNGDLSSLAKALGGTFSNGVFNMSGAANGAGYSLKVNAINGSSGGNASDKGGALGDTYASGLSLKKGAASTAGSQVAASGRDSMQGFDASGSGLSIGQSFANGISNAASYVSKAAKGLMNWAKSFFPHSPAPRGPFSGSGWSFISESGKAIVKTFAGGISDNVGITNDATSKWMDSVKSSVQMLSDGIDGNLDLNPTITPVLDLSNVKNLDLSSTMQIQPGPTPNYNNMNPTSASLSNSRYSTDDVVNKLTDVNSALESLYGVNSDQLIALANNAKTDIYLDKTKVGEQLATTITQTQTNLSNIEGMLGGIPIPI